MRQRCRDRVSVEADLGHDLGHAQRVDDIRLSGLAELVLMLFVGVFVCPLNDLSDQRRAHNGRSPASWIRNAPVWFPFSFLPSAFSDESKSGLFSRSTFRPFRAQADAQRLWPLLQLQKPLLCQHVEADACFSRAYGELRAAAKGSGSGSPALPTARRPAKMRPDTARRRQNPAASAADTGLVAAERAARQMLFIDSHEVGPAPRGRPCQSRISTKVQLHRAHGTVFVDLRRKGDIDHVALRHGGTLRVGREEDRAPRYACPLTNAGADAFRRQPPPAPSHEARACQRTGRGQPAPQGSRSPSA